ncbi:MAG: TetR/AcrR family transcriptional regulator [Nitrospinae bacterium]|nr:TetR/AcrR family transcriptional regulator [Nitrospinota bacterium]
MAKDENRSRDNLVRAAIELLWERSYQAASVEDLCDRARLKKGSFYYFFPSKTDLALEAVRVSWEHAKAGVFEPALQDAGKGLAAIQRIIDTIAAVQRGQLKRSGAFLGCPFGNLGQEMAHQDERLRAALNAIFDGHCAYLKTALDRAQQLGEIPPGDTARKARAIFALLEGALLMAKVAIVGSYPYPDKIGPILNGQRAVVKSGAGGPELARFLEIQGKVIRVILKRLKGAWRFAGLDWEVFQGNARNGSSPGAFICP